MQVNTCIPGFFFASLCFSDFSGIHLRPRWGRSAGVTFCRQKVTKDRQRRGLPPPCGIHPAGTGRMVHRSMFGPWPGEVTWMAWQSYCQFQLLWQINFYLQGLTLVSRCSQRSEARLPAAGTPLLQSRPGRGNHPAIGPAAQGGLVWWQN